MGLTFHAQPAMPGIIDDPAAVAPANPFLSVPYAEARAALGETPWLLGLRERGRWAAACYLFIRTGRFTRAGEIPSYPRLPAGAEAGFWRSLLDFAARQRLWGLSLNSFGSDCRITPPGITAGTRRSRCEHVLNLGSSDLWSGLSTNHRRNIARAHKQEVVLQRTRDPRASELHVRLTAASTARRLARGERADHEDRAWVYAALLEHGAGELFQVVRAGSIVSSAFLLLTPRGAYYHSAGTGPEGAACGASAFLVHQTACLLQGAGLDVLNLGGAGPDNPGLLRFKEGFGGQAVPLESVELSLAGPLMRGLRAAAHRARASLAHLTRGDTGGGEPTPE